MKLCDFKLEMFANIGLIKAMDIQYHFYLFLTSKLKLIKAKLKGIDAFIVN